MSKAGIFPYLPAHKEQLLFLLRLSTPAFFSPEEEKSFVYYLSHEIEQYFVVKVGGEIVGCGGINFDDNGSTGKISWDIIHPDYHGKGYGTLLLQHRLKILKQTPGVNKIIVRTSQHAWKFYEKNGFHLVKQEKDYWAKGFDLYLMTYDR